MNEKSFDMIADHAFRKVIAQYEKESEINTHKIFRNEDFFDYVEKRIAAVRAHNERYTTELVKGIINFYENQKQD